MCSPAPDRVVYQVDLESVASALSAALIRLPSLPVLRFSWPLTMSQLRRTFPNCPLLPLFRGLPIVRALPRVAIVLRLAVIRSLLLSFQGFGPKIRLT